MTRLPKDYPPLARKAIINLVTEDCPTVPLEDDGPEDPVLGIGKTVPWEDPEAGKPPGVKLNPTQGAEMAQVAHEVLPPALKTKPTEGQAVDVAIFYRPKNAAGSNLGMGTGSTSAMSSSGPNPFQSFAAASRP